VSIPRLRIFAGPNGSGKSTLKSVISDELLGIYINPDEIEKEINEKDFLDLEYYQISTTNEELITFFTNHPLLIKANLDFQASFLKYTDNKIDFHEVIVNSYFASVCADFIRQKLIKQKISFTFETVMSSRDKVELLKIAQENGYRTYLYYIATQDPIINISRVKNRVKFGGHDVPKEKIINRYYKSLELLKEAIRYSNRAYIFDNSNIDKLWLAEITDSKDVELKNETIPFWFEKYVLKAEL